MATAQAVGPLSSADHASELRRAVIASTVGTTIEWYDFFLYSTVTGLVFAKLYFPNDDPVVGTLNAFGVYFVGFIARPIGAAIFGHYGDRIGRKSTLIATLMLMGIATFLVAFVPGYAVIGIWGAVILTLLRFVQGIGVGGEWGGSVLLAMEWAQHNGQRGFIASWPQFGVPAGLFIANLTVLAVSAISGDAFLTWGWRVPFLLSIILVGIGLWIRLGINETPTFRRLVEQKKIERAPFIEVIKKQPVEILLTAFARMGQQAPYYIFTAFIFAYGTGTLHASRNMLLTAVLVASAISFVTTPLAGHVSDVLGRKKTYILGAIATGLYGFVYFGLLGTMSTVWIFIAVAASLIAHDFQYGPQAALIAEAFTPRLRYSGASLGYQFSSIIAGGPAPLIATWLFGIYHTGLSIAIYMVVCCAITVIATALLKDYTGKDIGEEYDA